jgi:hypothetical protein
VGLDAVEIVMGVEERFGIAIPNKAAEKITTPRLLVDFIASVVEMTPTDVCVSQRLFYRLRRGFQRQLATRAPAIELDTPLQSIVHKDQWPKVWAAVRADVGSADWPETMPWPSWFKDGPQTIRQMIWRIAEQLPKPSGTPADPWTRPMIEAEVRRIIRDVTGAEGFSLRADFAKEIGID